jgi:hypothetical protein
VAALDADPALGVACSAVRRDVEGTSHRRPAPWPIPLNPGRNDDVLPVLLREEWFLLPTACVWRRQVWSGEARQWHLDLRTTELQLFLSAAEAGWSFYFHPEPLAHWMQHPGQSGAPRGDDLGMAAADDALEFWCRWLQGRPAEYSDLSSTQRARCHLRRARAFVLTGRRAEARSALREATALGGSQLPGRRRLAVAVFAPSPIVRGVVGAKRKLQRAIGRLERTRTQTHHGGGSGWWCTRCPRAAGRTRRCAPFFAASTQRLRCRSSRPGRRSPRSLPGCERGPIAASWLR